MADKLAELKGCLEGMSGEGLRLVWGFTSLLVKHAKKKGDEL